MIRVFCDVCQELITQTTGNDLPDNGIGNTDISAPTPIRFKYRIEVKDCSAHICHRCLTQAIAEDWAGRASRAQRALDATRDAADPRNALCAVRKE